MVGEVDWTKEGVAGLFCKRIGEGERLEGPNDDSNLTLATSRFTSHFNVDL